ncbi:NAD(P)H oxidoreductase [Myxococcus stipitatus DSM 14675]|uniref:NAD(P)H oxidoreductase n=1 Tax=Myxococcus stipitatus (strain DSM 14675 / JCM 12634 / Mx s8) TaxID=1278073 RepID=L7UGM1_MYXSD|nr:NAD(P)H-dependent oxidoreductase [Myxococcus stipitatus]AGC47000.1 NAD(P)H oxidoreductase [Myxococcus stipitatus DSM 14675]
MNVLIVYAHPEPRSLNGSLKDLAVSHLTSLGHEVRVSDLYAMNWKATADAGDFLKHPEGERLAYARASKHAFTGGTQSADVAAEQEKLLWADAVIFQFPMWWFSMPAILKGWVDRVFAYGFAYGVGAHGGERWGDRYGEGTLTGRRAMLSVTIGGRPPHYTDRGVNGALDDLLFPIQHGIIYYPGMEALPPFSLYMSDRLTPEQWPAVAEDYKARLDGLFTDAPIPFRRQNGGHYDTQQVLKPGLAVGTSGTRIHLLHAGEPEQAPLAAPRDIARGL